MDVKEVHRHLTCRTQDPRKYEKVDWSLTDVLERRLLMLAHATIQVRVVELHIYKGIGVY
jgi:hypothetical protein